MRRCKLFIICIITIAVIAAIVQVVYFIELFYTIDISSLSSIAANASDSKKKSVIRGIYSESLVNDKLIIDTHPNDTVIYTGIFNSRRDSVSISTSTSEKIDVFIRPMSQNQYTTYFHWNNKVVDSLNVRYENGNVFVNDDYYVLSSESYSNFREVRSVLALSHLLIDCLGDYPRDILKLLNLNWDVDFYQYHIEKAVTTVQSPHSDMIYKFESVYAYDKHNEFIEIVQKDRYTRKVIKRNQHQIQYLITYNYGDRLSGEYTQTYNLTGDEIFEGYYTQVPSQQEFTYKQIFQVIDDKDNN